VVLSLSPATHVDVLYANGSAKLVVVTATSSATRCSWKGAVDRRRAAVLRAVVAYRHPAAGRPRRRGGRRLVTSLCQRQGGGEADDSLVQCVDHEVEEDLGL